MKRLTTTEVPNFGAEDWRDAAEEVLERARAISRQADDRVREVTDIRTQTMAAQPREAWRERKPAN